MRHLPRPLIALITALLLVFAQQAALTHMIGHGLPGGGAATQSVLQQDEQQHDTAASLSHVCTTCIAFAALDGFAPSQGMAPLPVAESHTSRPESSVAFLGQEPLTYRARGPPQHL